LVLLNNFITFEGGEGSGKTTSISKIKVLLEKQGYHVIVTREPGGVRIAEDIRSVILGKGSEEIDIMTEMLLYAAARREHLVKKVIPALEEGFVVLCDRFVDSSVVYQGYVRGQGEQTVLDINNLVIGDYMPGLTLFYDVDPEIALNRINVNETREKNRFDLEGLKFHNKVREGYQNLAKNNSVRIKTIDAGKSIEEVVFQVTSVLNKHFKIIE
jgi:dTMP kinase